MTDKQEVEKYFGANLVSENILPVFVVVENRSESSSFLLSKDQISFRTEDAISPISSGRENIATDSTGIILGVVGIALISIPISILGG